jgi:hypothetical protein
MKKTFFAVVDFFWRWGIISGKLTQPGRPIPDYQHDDHDVDLWQACGRLVRRKRAAAMMKRT